MAATVTTREDNMHPALRRMRPAQDRALHLLDTEHGPLEDTTVIEDRAAVELAARTHARTLLTDEMRLWLEHVEQAQQSQMLATLGIDTAEPEPVDEPDDTAELHRLLTIATRAQHGT
jgi:hypothetical protein